MVRLAGIEPARLAARDFKSLVSTYFTTVAYLVEAVRFELTDPVKGRQFSRLLQ